MPSGDQDYFDGGAGGSSAYQSMCAGAIINLIIDRTLANTLFTMCLLITVFGNCYMDCI